MKFKFCGDNDCQDWILAQISVLSKLSSIKIKIVIKEVINHILTGKLDFAKISKITSDAKLNDDDTRAILAALNFIIVSSVRYDTDSEIVSNELQQLGLPKEHSVALCKAYLDNISKIKEALLEQSLKYSTLKSCSFDIISKFKNDNCSIECPSLFLNVHDSQSQKQRSNSFYITPEKLNCLINDLKGALQYMENINI